VTISDQRLATAKLELHALVERSLANGPGERAVVWVQGCSLGCPGCFNPETHLRGAGTPTEVTGLAQRIGALASAGVSGLTLTGGEPLQQLAAVTALVRQVRRLADMSILLFTGYTLEEVRALPGSDSLLAALDVVIAGRYQHGNQSGHRLLGSTNQTLHLITARHRPADFDHIPEAELLIRPDGQIVATGIVALPIRKL
jgi:anaerobic ribonucleoside-triphosphate reductase activating protein